MDVDEVKENEHGLDLGVATGNYHSSKGTRILDLLHMGNVGYSDLFARPYQVYDGIGSGQRNWRSGCSSGAATEVGYGYVSAFNVLDAVHGLQGMHVVMPLVTGTRLKVEKAKFGGVFWAPLVGGYLNGFYRRQMTSKVQRNKGFGLRPDHYTVMEQIFGLVNTFLQNHRDTWKWRLRILTYQVVRFTHSAGVLEWVSDNVPLGEYLIGRFWLVCEIV
ncbi:hypothetical protein POM88_049613 [Heracleum sosnowskyi]|uniref:Uncharacterized protein n=1 Tax=Heracleum sosnowskyi TaxID=360622 RepID=A0AAD8M1Q4_9APIA|nr:hypothetical protein POM88_049613 [Heracleum sosnowskyi]